MRCLIDDTIMLMIVLFYGTSAELIKCLGVINGVRRDQLLLVCTAQQKSQIEQFHHQSGIEPDIYLAMGWRGRDVHSILEMLGFMIKVHFNFFVKYIRIKKIIKDSNSKNDTKSLGVVHGDTLTTVVGAYFTKLLGLKLAHIEAGLRSGKVMHPFPEEIDRRIVSKLANIHFAPNQNAVDNLVKENTKGEIIDTKYNTSKDAIEVAMKYSSKIVKSLNLPKSYGLVSIHRTELLERKNDLQSFLEVISKFASKNRNIVFIDHATTREKIRSLNFDKYLLSEGILRIPKLAYMDFIQVAKMSDYILTDSGGLQEDAYFMGVPTMIHRITTERNEGLGVNIELSGLDISKVEKFLSSNKAIRLETFSDSFSPSGFIINYLLDNKYII